MVWFPGIPIDVYDAGAAAGDVISRGVGRQRGAQGGRRQTIQQDL